VATRRFQDLKWGTRNPIMMRDPDFGPVRLRAFGTYSIRVSDPGLFLREVVGTDGEVTTDEVQFQIRNVIVSRFSNALASSGIPVLDLAANTRELGQIVAKEISAQIAEYGLTLPELYIENISLPPAVEAVMDKRSSMGVIGNLNEYMQFQAAEALGREGGGAGDAMQAGLGAAMGLQLGQQAASGPWGAQQPARSAAATPPPPPVEHVWHVAENGQTKGPFSKAQLGRMAQSGALGRESYVWTAGQDGWMKAEDVTELAQLFTILPPPPPPGV
ncbi:MAG: SPFH domain-containing protein, partial [Pseudomonadota bacterium]